MKFKRKQNERFDWIQNWNPKYVKYQKKKYKEEIVN